MRKNSFVLNSLSGLHVEQVRSADENDLFVLLLLGLETFGEVKPADEAHADGEQGREKGRQGQRPFAVLGQIGGRAQQRIRRGNVKVVSA